MNLRLEQLAKWASLIALIVLIGAPTFNINKENKIMATGTGVSWGLGAGFNNGASNYIDANGNPTTAPTDVSTVVNNPNQLNPAAFGGVPMQEAQLANPDGTFQTGPTAEQIAEQNRQAAARNSFNQGRDVYNTSITGAIGSQGQNFQRGVQDWVSAYNKSQTGLDSRAINAEMAKKQGYNGILGMVGQGIKSGGVMLANKNAGNSSAAQAIADAYSKLGQQQAADVNNQYGQATNQIGLDQTELDAAKALQISRWGEDKTTIVNNIISEAKRSIAALNDAAAGASIADRIDIAAEAERVKQAATAELAKYDGEMTKANGAQTADQRRNQAQFLASTGRAPDQSFNYSTQAPTQWQNTGPFASELPIFTYNANKNKYQG